MNERFELTKTSLFYTHEPEDAIRVVEGSVYVYIVPWSEESAKAGKRGKCPQLSGIWRFSGLSDACQVIRLVVSL